MFRVKQAKSVTRKFKKILITGISGSGGSLLAEHINKKQKNIKIFGLYRGKGHIESLKKNVKKNLFLIKCDLQNFSNLKKIIYKVNPCVIFHLASNADVRKSFDKPREIIKNNNEITLNLLDAIRELKIKPLVLICSTSEVYGSVRKKNLPITEKNQISPINPYAASKAFQDLVSQVYYKCYNIPIIITRMFSYNNPRRKNLFQSAFADQIVNIEKGKQKILLHGNLNSLRTSLDINDAMESYWLASTKGKIGEIYNISGKKSITVRNFLRELIKNSNIKIKTQLNSKLLRKTDIMFQVPDPKKFIRHTGWKEKVKFSDSIQNFLNFFRGEYK